MQKKRGFIPIVDMENFPTIYNEKNKINFTQKMHGNIIFKI